MKPDWRRWSVPDLSGGVGQKRPRNIIIVFENQARLEENEFVPDHSSGGGPGNA